MTLPRERNSSYVNKTVTALDKLGYDWRSYDSIDGRTEDGLQRVKEIEDLWNVTFSLPNSGAVGLWANKLDIMTKGLANKEPVVSLEGDTEPIRDWGYGLPKGWSDYDVLFLHHHDLVKKPCLTGGIVENIDSWYATGTILFTSKHPERWEKALRGKTIKLNDDHWMNFMFKSKNLKIGQVCPYFFRQHTNHQSTVRPDEKNEGFILFRLISYLFQKNKK